MLGAAIGWSLRDLSWPFAGGQGQRTASDELSPGSDAASASGRSQTMPITPGTWTWTRKEDASVAQFGDGLVTITCDAPAKTISIARRADAAADSTVTILSSTQTRAFEGSRQGGQIVVTLDAGDALLDALALSRGRFGVAVAGLDAVYPGSWAEVSRVVEDCRPPPANAPSARGNSGG